MSSRRSRPSATATPARQIAEPQLPEYQPPKHPLNAQGQKAFRDLQSKNMDTLTTHFKTMNEQITQSAYEINELLATQRDWLQKALQKPNPDKVKHRIAVADALGERVESLTGDLESKVRETIDAQEKLRARQEQLKALEISTRSNNGRVHVAATQSTLGASQFRPRTDGDDAEEEEENEPTTPPVGPGIYQVLQERLAEHEQSYAELSLPQRYAEHNDYIAFRNELHSGRNAHLEDQPILAPARTWFNDNGPVLNTDSQVQDSTQHDEDGDSDIEAVAENVSTKCPLTLVEMKDPVKSKKCPHTFERKAIEEMLAFSSMRVGGGRTGQKMVKCPVCDVNLTAGDLTADTALKRRIERIAATQARNNNADEDDEEDEFGQNSRGMPRAQTVDSQFEANLEQLTQIKAERASGVSRRSIVPGTQKQEQGNDQQERQTMRPPRSTVGGGGSGGVVNLQDNDDDDEDEMMMS